MKNFTYYRPTAPDQAIALLGEQWGATELLAGGTDLLDLQKEYVAQPDKIVSLRDLGAAYEKVTVNKENVVIGALTKLADIAANAELRKLFPGLTTAAGDIGGPQIRNMGTLGGNLCQRNRCWFFRDEQVNCLLKGGTKCFALDGENQYHAIFTQGLKCVIVHPSTLAPALAALGATAEVQGPKGKRQVKVAEFFHNPASAKDREHVLAPNEIVLSVSIPNRGTKNASYEVRSKQAYDWPLVQAAVAFRAAQAGGPATGVQIVLGHVAPTPIVSATAAKQVEGKPVTEATASAAGKAAAESAKPLSQNAYKVKLVEVAVKRALLTAAGGKKYWEI